MKLGREFLSFAVVGTVGFLVDVSVLYALAPWLGWYLARVASFLAAATATWLLNRRFTFAGSHRDQPIWREYLAYLVTVLGGAVVNYAAYAATLHWYAGPGAAALGVALGSIAGLAVNFVSVRFLVFRPRDGG